MKTITLNKSTKLLATGLLLLSTTVFGQNELSVSLTKTDVSCYGSNDGTIDAMITGGTEPYSIDWNIGFHESTLNHSAHIENLVSDSYTILVTDANNQTVYSTITVGSPAPIRLQAGVTQPTSPTAENGAIDLTVIGGVSYPNGSFDYTWSNGNSTEDLNNINSGVYEIFVQDMNGCSSSRKVIVKTTIRNIGGQVLPSTPTATQIGIVYPNPSFGNIQFKLLQDVQEITIINSTNGSIVKQLKNNQVEAIVNDLPRGEYVIHYSNTNGTQTEHITIL